MPELPEVETTKTSLEPLLNQTVTQVMVHQPKLRYPVAEDLESLVGYQLVGLHRRAKYLLLEFYHKNNQAKKTLLIHLGMSGSLQQHQDLPKRKHDHVVWQFNHQCQLHYHDPRKFGMILWLENDDFIGQLDTEARFLAHLGPEPLDKEFDTAYLYQAIHNKRKPINKPIKAVIMDQAIVVGVGNIYAAESLFLSNIHPATPACQLSLEHLEVLVENIKKILAKAIKKGGSSLKDFTVGEGKTGYFQQTLSVYGRLGQPCLICHHPLENLKIAGRASVFCPNCQQMPSIKSPKK